MPRGISLNDENILKRFKEIVQSRTDFNITLNKNYSLFSDKIFEKTGSNLSASTLKRIFSDNSKTKPTKYSLDTIARAVDYDSWDDFVKKDVQFSDFERHEIIYNLKYESYLDVAEFNAIFNRYFDTPYCYNITYFLIEAAVKKNDEDVLLTIFNLPKVWDMIADNYMSYYFMEKVGMLFRDTTIIHKLIPHYSQHPVAQTSYIEIFIDEEQLNGYYGELLEAYAVHKTTPEAQLFYHSMMCQRDFENGDLNSSHFNYILKFVPTQEIKPKHLVRRLALLVVKYIDNKVLVDSLLEEFSVLIEKLEENEFNYNIYKFCQIVFQSREAYPIKKTLNLMTLNTDYFSYNYFINRLLNLIKIYESFALAQEGDIKGAHDKLASYNRLFCYPNSLRKSKIHFNVVNRIIESEMKKIGNTL